MASVTMVGPYTYGTNNTVYNVWHSKPVSASGAVLSAVGTFTATRSASTITISASITITGENSGVTFGYPLWFYVKANGTTIHTWTSDGNLNISGKGSSWSKSFDSFEYTNNNEVNLSFTVHCAAGTGTGTSESGSCDQGYTYVDLVNQNTSSSTLISIPAYNPWTDPTNLKNVKVSPLSIKPEGEVTVSWTKAQSGTGNTIDKYQVDFKDSADSSWTTYKNDISSSSSSVTFQPLSKRSKIKPGETLSFRVRAHYNSSTSGHSSSWMSWVTASSSYTVSVYKDGIIYYQQTSSARKNCVLGYYQQTSSAKKKARYILVQSGTNTRRIIDEYTTHYE